MDVAKCNIEDCLKFDTCGHGRNCRGQPLYNFKHFCKNEDKYFEWYEGEFREIVKETREEGAENNGGSDNMPNSGE